MDTPLGKVPQVKSKLSWADRRGRWAMRWGFGRDHYRVTPGLYAVGRPDDRSPLLISANYKLSFDCLRHALAGENAWLLVIDTKGVNVWCAAGKGTFSTDEIVRRCRQVQVERLVSHRQIVVPQLGAPGVAGYKVKQETGFSVIYGPVRANDLKTFIAAGMHATEEMRQVTFNLWERLILTPVEVTILYKQILIATLALFILSGIGADIFSFSAAWHRGIAAVAAGLTGVLTGSVLMPILLPWLPTRAFASKGALLGLITATVLALGPYQAAGVGGLICLYLLVVAIASYTAMNFTGSSTFTSPSGVEKEMRIAIPCQALAVLTAGLVWIGAAF
ncbi:MAG: carbon monoxide dehydrogenase [Deltaproteobacteria bacterium]|nr:carbon monoxide dehydrogenase [Deltaproteobacteria bacterium]